MENPERSSFIFNLADKYGIPYKKGHIDIIEDSSFLQFCDEYKKLSDQRDKALSLYLKKNPSYFRSLIPYSSEVFQIASRTVWYYDELLVRDPITKVVLPLTQNNLEPQKQNVIQILEILNLFRDAISSGYLLLAGEHLVPNYDSTGMNNVIHPEYDRIINNSDVRKALEDSIEYGLEIRKDGKDLEWYLYRVDAGHGFLIGFTNKSDLPSGKNTSPPFKVGEKLRSVSRSEIQKVTTHDFIKQIEDMYPREVKITIHNMTISTLLDVPILFYKKRDSVIANVAGYSQELGEQQNRIAQGLNLTLPYIKDLDFQKLGELREKLPAAFIDFRGEMTELVTEALKDDPHSANKILSEKSKRLIVPNLEKMKREIEESAKRNRWIAYGGVGAAITGTLLGSVSGLGIAPIIALNLAAILNSIKTYTEHKKVTEEKLPSNPFYFLWKTKN